MFAILYSIDGKRNQVSAKRFRLRAQAHAALYHDLQMAKDTGHTMIGKVVWAGY